MAPPGDEDAEQVTNAAEGGGEVTADEQDDLAAEWESMVGTDDDGSVEVAAGAGQETTRVLNQDEIDSLLGSDDEGEAVSEKGGIHTVLNSGLVSYERLPMLEVVFDRLVRMM